MPPEPPTPDEISKLFPLARLNEMPFLFELALVLGGSVSAGAYTAGAIDALLEMLDAWHAGNPPHRITIPIVTGTSGGAILTGMIGLIARKAVQPVTASYATLSGAPKDLSNVFFDTWVNAVDGLEFLSASDVSGGTIPSLLNSELLDRIAQNLRVMTASAGDFMRPYFPDPYRCAVTVTNLRGVPYLLQVPDFGDWTGGDFRALNDTVRFAVPIIADVGGKRPDEYWIDPAGDGADIVGYQTLLDYAIASAAFPIGLKARSLTRPLAHYAYRPFVRRLGGTAVVECPQPDWPQMIGTDEIYSFTAVDGGTYNNDPLVLARQTLGGYDGDLPRDAQGVNQAVLLIDPLAAKPRRLPVPAADLLSVALNLTGNIVDGARFLTADMTLIADPDAFSHFQLVPVRSDVSPAKIGCDALATAEFSAFGGFFCREFRLHDFLLGRLNMRDYLRRVLVLRGDNALFGQWEPALRERFAVDNAGNKISGALPSADAYYLPVIPDLSYVDGLVAVMPNGADLPWPFGKLNPEALRQPFQKRVSAVLNDLKNQELTSGWAKLVADAVEGSIASVLTNEIIATFHDALAAQDLLAPRQTN